GVVNQQNAHYTTPARSIKSLTWNLGPRLTKIKETQADILVDLTNVRTDTTEIKYMTGPSFTTPKLDKGKGIATGTEDTPIKLKKASKKVRQDPDEAALLDFQLHDGRVVKMIHDAIDQYLEKTEKVKNVELSRIEIGKVVAEEVMSVDAPIKGGKDFLK
ncbi:hypothetical protein Tco_1231845, partial [Tanacetum coccineum]